MQAILQEALATLPQGKPRFEISRESFGGVTNLHDGVTLREYLRWIGFSTDIHDQIIHDIASFYDVHFRGSLLFAVESGPSVQCDIRNAAEAICEHFENRAIEQGRIAPQRGR